MDIITENGLTINLFDQRLASIIGNTPGSEGLRVYVEAKAHKRNCVEVCDWIFCLARSPSSVIRKCFIEEKQVNTDAFVNMIQESLDFESESSVNVTNKLVEGNVSPAVRDMLNLAGRNLKEGKQIDEITLTKAIFSSMCDDLRRLLSAFLDKDDDDPIKKIEMRFLTQFTITEPLRPDGTLDKSFLSANGINFLRRVTEDAASIRAKKITTRHILYSLLTNEANGLSMALRIHNIDILNDLHAPLTRELTWPGKKRGQGMQADSETLMSAVVHLLKQAQKYAHESGNEKVGENHIARALIELYPDELTRLLPPSKILDMAAVRRYVAESSAIDEDDNVISRYTIKEIRTKMKEVIIGQDPAIDMTLPWIERLRFGLPREERPAGVFLFMGPTGTGKTQLAKELARFVFGNDDMMIRLDMGQYQTKESMNNIVGASPGYVGYGEGTLTNGLRDKPECIVLLDEIEKAHTEVFDALLRFADEGLIADPAGPIRNGQECIIVMTTNAGQQWLRDYIEKNPEAVDDPEELSDLLFKAAMKELKDKGFRPEFLGRVDERITFLPFTEDVCRKIVDKVLNKELAQITNLKGVSFIIEEDVKQFLGQVALGRSMDEGARGIPRAINTHIITPIIRILTECKEEKGYLPDTLEAVATGTDTQTEVEFHEIKEVVT